MLAIAACFCIACVLMVVFQATGIGFTPNDATESSRSTNTSTGGLPPEAKAPISRSPVATPPENLLPEAVAATPGDGYPSLDVVGRVIDGDGEGIPVAAVAVVWGRAGDVPQRVDAVTDEEGRYRCRVSPAESGLRLAVAAACPGFKPAEAHLIVGASDTHHVDLKMFPGNAMFGRVLCRGEVVVGAQALVVARGSDGSITTCEARTFADGVFAIGFHAAVRAEKVVVFHGALGVAEHPCLDRATGGDLGTIELVPHDPLAAQLVNRGGQPLSGLQVTVKRTTGDDLDGGLGGCFWNPITDASGAFVLYGLRAGSYNVFVGGTTVAGFAGPIGQIATGSAQKVFTLPCVRVRAKALRGDADYPASEVWAFWYRQLRGSWEADPLNLSMDRLVEVGSVWRVDLVRRRDQAVVASQVVDTASQAFIEVLLRAPPQ